CRGRRVMGSAEGDRRVGSLEHWYVIGAVPDGNNAFEAQVANALDCLSLVENVLKANHAPFDDRDRRVSFATDSLDQRLYPDIKVPCDDEALSGPGSDEIRELRVKPNVI